MADGSIRDLARERNDKKSLVVAYQDEEFGLGYEIARNITGARTTPRGSTADTLSTLMSGYADQAIIPLEHDKGSYNTKSLSALIDFPGVQVTDEESEDDEYVLAVPSDLIYELAEAAFPSSYKNGMTVGNLPSGMQSQHEIYKRITNVYASSDAMNRCAPAVDGLRAQGLNINRLPDEADPYRTVLAEARQNLDPNRMIKTEHNDFSGNNLRSSAITGAAYTKGLSAVILPLKLATMGRDNIDKGYNTAPDLNGDYVIIGEPLQSQSEIKSRFLVLSKKPAPPSDLLAKPIPTQAHKKIYCALEAKFDGAMRANQAVKCLFKVDSRGAKTHDPSEISRRLVKKKIDFTQTILTERQDTVPIVFEAHITDEEQLKGMKDVLKLAFQPNRPWVRHLIPAVFFTRRGQKRNWNPQFLGAYVGDAQDLPKVSVVAPGFPWQGLFQAIVLIGLMALLIYGVMASGLTLTGGE